MDPQDIIQALGLIRHPEGGYYSETYRSKETIKPLSHGHDGHRSLSTAIYYLLTADDFSAMHRIGSDEIYHFYLGDPVEILCLFPGGRGEVRRLGPDLDRGAQPQQCVTAGVWQGLRVIDGGRFALLGTTVAPGFDFEDFELADPGCLESEYPSWTPWIRRLCKSTGLNGE